jgi:mono/diheme cytochrome c family protein
MTEVVAEHRGADRFGLAVAMLAAVFSLIATFASAEDIPAAAVAEADTVWQQRCTTCHGATGKGDGAAAAALNPKPRDFSLATWQASVTDEHIEKTILEGGQAVGLSMLMVANPDLASKPDVIKALRAHVRSLGAK